MSGVVKLWVPEEGWGVLVSDDVPRDVWAHFSSVDGIGYRELSTGDPVDFRYRGGVQQDGYEYVAESVRRTAKVAIEPLGQHPDLVQLTVDWHLREFDPEGDIDFWLRARTDEARQEGIPCAWVAFVNGDPVGSVSLIAHNMDSHLELTPWLAALFVLPAFRRRGIGQALATRCQEEAWVLGFERLYLYTERAEAIAWYRKRDWSPLFEETYEDQSTLVMAIDRP